MRQLHNFFQLSGRERYLLFISIFLLSIIRLCLWLLPFRTILKILKKTRQNQPKISLSAIVWAVNVATKYTLGSAKCLARALTVQILMSHYGYSCELRMGVVKRETGILEAHAWIEYQGQVVIGGMNNLSEFVPLSFGGDRGSQR